MPSLVIYTLNINLVGVYQTLKLLKSHFLIAFTKHSQPFQLAHFHSAIIKTATF